MILDIPILVLAVATNFVLAAFVYVRNPSSATHRLFALLGIVLSAWSITNYLSIIVHTEEEATLLVRSVMFFSVPIGALFLILMHTYPSPVLKMNKRYFWAYIGAMFVTMGVTLTPLLFPKVTIHAEQPPTPTPGIGMVLYVPVVIVGILYGLFILVRKYRRASGIRKVQTRYLLIGVAAMFLLIISLNFVAVNVFNTTVFIPFAPLFTLPFTGLTAYSIIRYRLLDIKAAILKSLSFTFLVGAVLGIYGLLFVFAVPIVSEAAGIGSGIIAGVMALISIPIARYVRDILMQLTDKFLFQDRPNYRAELVKRGRKLSRHIQIKQVANVVGSAMKEVLRSSSTVIFLREPSGEEYIPRSVEGIRQLNVSIPKTHAFVRHLTHAAEPIIKDELQIQIEQERQQKHLEELQEINNAMEWLDAAVVVPMFVEKGLSGFIILGNKLSGEPYLQEDLEFLEALAPQAATALENARLYKESLEFGERLKDEVERATHELEIANEQLKDLDKAKSEFLSIASHQLYTPLTAIRGYLSMIQEGDFGETAEKQKPVFDILNKSAVRLIELIKNLLDISRIESGRLELNLESVDLTAMAKELVADLMPNAMTKNLDLQFLPPAGPLPHVVVDQGRLRQVMLNFIDNAIKYTDRGRIRVTLTREGDEIVFAVSDTGKGITRDEIKRLFTKFTRVGGASKYHTEGTGLGLYVARQIVREHHGEVEVTSPGPGKGSTFSMRVPAQSSPRSLKLGDHAMVEIKAAESESRPSGRAAESQQKEPVAAP